MDSKKGSNSNAAWMTKAGTPLTVSSANIPHAGPNQIVVKNYAVAINPIDWIVQYLPMIFSYIKTPMILGADVAGQVVEVGSNVTRFKVGDRVLGHSAGYNARGNNVEEGAFQEHVVLRENVTSLIPDTMPFADASVLPLALSTAACGMYQKNYLALQPPSVTPKPTGETLIVWGASSSVGCNAVQLACASGYDVVATASPKNFEYIKKLGAKTVFDYRSNTVIEDMIAALKDTKCAGAVAICDGSSEACIEILSAVEGRKFVAQMSVPLAKHDITTSFGKVRGFLAVMQFNAMLMLRKWYKGVDAKFVIGDALIENEIGHMIFRDYLPEALKQGQFVVAPSPIIVGNGLDRIQEALDMNRRGMSAGKAVVTLS